MDDSQKNKNNNECEWNHEKDHNWLNKIKGLQKDWIKRLTNPFGLLILLTHNKF